MNKFLTILALGTLCSQFMACNKSAPKCCESESAAATSTSLWKDELKAVIPLLGHRNWIVVTDMAYPLQTQDGIKTVYTNENYMNILDFVYKEIEKAPHVKAAIYQDKELLYLNEKDAAGIDSLREQMKTLFGNNRTFILHEELISRLDEVSKIFNVVILKSNLTIPYTSTFFELDCKYWDGTKELKIEDGKQSLRK
jgi:D-ribose pyranose/furanose isomerase RbsD